MTTERVWIGADPNGLGFEVAVAEWAGDSAPTQEAMRTLHAARLRNRAIPLCIVLHDAQGQAWLHGPIATAPVLGPLPAGQATRIVQAALDEPSASAARARLLRSRDAFETAEIPGFHPQGLFAIRELTYGVPRRRDWSAACDRSAALLAASPRGVELIRALGFDSRTVPGNALLLTIGSRPARAVAILLRDDESFDAESARFLKSPIYHGLEIARQNNVPWLVVARGPELRLYPSSPDVGVSRRGATQTYFGLDLALLDDEHSGYLDLVFGAHALEPQGSVDQLLAASRDYAVALGERLRERIYDKVVAPLSVAVARALATDAPLRDARLELAYRLTLRILFRLLFQAYAEDTRLLPLHLNLRYTRASLKELARDLAEQPDRPHDDPRSTSLWDGLLQVWRVIDVGDRAWGVPAYNGGLFGTDPGLHPDGAAIAVLRLHNDVLGPVLEGLLVDETGDGSRGPVDFRALDVRDFGTIYEGLLESGLSIAETDQTVDAAGAWRPAAPGDTIEAAAGEPYFHTKSGDRKATGSYFTKPFAVEHLLERALDPAIDAHLAKIENLVARGDQVGAARAFFDFRVADLAMGSGHFLVGAIGHIEAKFGTFLEREPIPGVERELLDLGHAAVAALEEVGVEAEVMRAALLSRQIARRCVYGLDVNQLAVDLARLAIWVRTFVPGLPMSSLDHQLVCGNALTGIGTIEEAIEALDPGAAPGVLTFTGAAIRSALDTARDLLEDAAALKEATRQESQAAQAAAREAVEAAQPARLLFDAAVAVRLGTMPPPADFDAEGIARSAASRPVQDELAELAPAHLPARFPEVFLREPPGFDVILGNPPWEEVMVDETTFWSTRQPRFRGRPPAEQRRLIATFREDRPDLVAVYEAEVAKTDLLRRALSAGQYPGMNEGNADLYKAFCWRFWALVREGGRIGVVLPRAAMSGSGSEAWRTAIFDAGQFEDVTILLNTRQWVFDGVDGRYTFALLAAAKGNEGGAVVRIRGPFTSLEEYQSRIQEPAIEFAASEFRTWATGGSFPLLPTADAGSVFQQMRRQPRLDAPTHPWRARPVQGDFNATSDRDRFVFDPPDTRNLWPVLSGAAINIWTPETGQVFAWAEMPAVTEALQEKRLNQQRRPSSAFAEFAREWAEDPATLPCRHPRIAFRDVTNRTNTRTVIPALLPPNVIVTNAAPYFLWPRGDERDQAYLLGVLSSIPLDWYARSVVEMHVNFHLLNAFPVPNPEREDRRRRRVEEISGRFAAVDARYARWAAAAGVEVGGVTQVEQDDLIAELDAVVSHLYELDRSQVEHIFATFHRGWDYSDRLARVLAHYDRWATRR